MPPLIIAGRVITPEYALGLLQPLDGIREVLLDQEKNNFAASVSEVMSIVKYYAENVEVAE